MRIVYFGSPDFAVPPLAALGQAGHEIAGVVTQPDKPRHRGKLEPTPVKALGLELGLPVIAPEKVNAPASLEQIRSWQPQLLVVVAYGQLLSPALLNTAPMGAINIHGSLLPAYRGAAPIQWALMRGEKETGVTIMYLDEGMDSGDIILQRATPISEEDTCGTIHDRLCDMGTKLLLEAISLLETGQAPRIPQDSAQASFAPMITKDLERVDWRLPAIEIHRRLRALDPWPGSYTLFQGKRLKLWGAAVDQPPASGPYRPGQVLAWSKTQLWIGCGQGALRIAQVQPEGRGRISAGDFVRGYPVDKETVFQ